MLTLFKSEIFADANYFWLLFFWTNIVWAGVMCYDSLAQERSFKEKKNRQKCICQTSAYLFSFPNFLIYFLNENPWKVQICERKDRAEEEVISGELLPVVVLTHEDYICVM